MLESMPAAWSLSLSSERDSMRLLTALGVPSCPRDIRAANCFSLSPEAAAASRVRSASGPPTPPMLCSAVTATFLSG